MHNNNHVQIYLYTLRQKNSTLPCQEIRQKLDPSFALMRTMMVDFDWSKYLKIRRKRIIIGQSNRSNRKHVKLKKTIL